jgi:hypothetical protein
MRGLELGSQASKHVDVSNLSLAGVFMKNAYDLEVNYILPTICRQG